MENNTITFRTKTGYCHIQPDKIVLSANSNPITVFKIPSARNVFQRLMMYSLLSLCLLIQAYTSFKNNEIFLAIFLGIGGIFLIYVVIASANNSGSPVVERATIQKVKFTKAIPWIRRSYISVFFNENGKVKKRLIFLPGSLTGGAEETEKALEIMKREGLLK